MKPFGESRAASPVGVRAPGLRRYDLLATPPMPLTPAAVSLLRLLAKCPKDGLRIRFSAYRYQVADSMTYLHSWEPLVRFEASPRTGGVTAFLTDAGRAELEAL